jgi:hypothetical protein
MVLVDPSLLCPALSIRAAYGHDDDRQLRISRTADSFFQVRHSVSQDPYGLRTPHDQFRYPPIIPTLGWRVFQSLPRNC